MGFKTDIEETIVDKLKSVFGSNLDIQPFPDKPENYELLNVNGAVLPRYSGTFGSTPLQVQQAEIMNFELIIMARSLRNAYGIYDLLEQVKDAVTSIIYDTGRFYCTTERFMSYSDGVWQYSQMYSLPVIYSLGEN